MTSAGAPVRLLIDATALVAERRTGVGNVLLHTLRALDEPAFDARVDVRIFVPFDERRALRRFRFRRIRVVLLPLPHRVVGALARLRISIPIDLLLGRGVYFFPNFRNWALARSRSITFVHDVCFAVLPEFVPEPRRAFLQRFVPMWLRRTDIVAAGSPSAAAEIVRALGVPAARVRVLPTTVDTALYTAAPREAVTAVKAELALERYVLFVGTIEPRKNVAALVTAYAAADRPAGHSLLLVGGTGWQNTDVFTAIDAARAAGADVRVSNHYIDDDSLVPLITGADALALTSWHEGFGLPALEAIACGTPVIVSDIPGLRDAVRGNEDHVRFVDPADTHSISSALSEAMAEPVRVEDPTVAPWSGAAEALVTAAESLARR